MSRFIYIAGVDDASVVRFPDGYQVTSAADTGTVNMGRVEIDDPSGSLDIVPRKGAYIVETAAPSGHQRIWTGYIQNVTIDRGPYKVGAGRVWRADCVDINFDLTRRAIVSGKRPAETDIARLTWLLADASTTGLVHSGTLTNLTDNVKNLDAADYTAQKPMDVLVDVAPQCGKRTFAIWNESNARAELFYDLADAAVHTSSSKISNVLADITTGVYWPFVDASLERLGEEIASKWTLRWVGGITRQTRSDTQSTYGEFEFATESTRIGRAATASSWVATQLTAHQAPQDRVTVSILLPAANVNDITEGERFQNKYTHIPGLTSYAYRRVISRITKVHESDDYLVQYVLDNTSRTAGGNGNTGGFPNPTGTAAIVLTSTDPGYPNPQVQVGTVDFYNGDVWQVTYTVSQASDDGASGVTTEIHEVSPGSGSYAFESWGHPSGSPAARTDTINVSYGGSEPQSYHLDLAWTTDLGKSGAGLTSTATMSLVTPGPNNPNEPTGSAVPPKPGQWVGISPPELVTLTAGAGTTAFPFADGSLRVFYDIVEQTAAIVSYDGATGAFTMPSQPPLGTQVFVQYQGR